MSHKTNSAQQGERLPCYIPQWLKRRVEVDVYALYDFVKKASVFVPPKAWVLDAGAGEGRFKLNFVHAHYIGVDLAVGTAGWDYRGLDAISDLCHLPLVQDIFDVTICIQVLEHVQEPLQVLREICRVLRPGGRLFLSAPQSWPQHQKPHDFYRYTSFGIQYLVEQAGLKVESICPVGGYFWFLSVQLQNINFWLFPRNMEGRQWTWPFRAIFGLFFQLILPLLFFYLDPLDQVEDETLGYLCVAAKPTDGA